MSPSKRLVVLPWSCNRSGDCCRHPAAILFSREEAALAQAARPDLPLTFYTHPDNRFVYLKGQPCPLLQDGPQATCTIWPVRPYNCRRFGCFRPDVATEPYESEPLDPEHLRLGCANLSDRLADRGVRRAYAQMQRKAQRWALKHGWSQEMAPTPVGSNVVFYRGRRETSSTPRPVAAASESPVPSPPEESATHPPSR